VAESVTIVDLGMGNLRSVQRAVERAANDAGVSARVRVDADADSIADSDRVIVPGQGAFRALAERLRLGLGDALRDHFARGRPYLGICLGLQALFDSSEEAPGAAGLGLFSGLVRRLPDGGIDASSGAPVKVPHMGWNRISLQRSGAGPLAIYDASPPFVYFVHSYHVVPEDESLVAATADHGPHTVTAAVQRDNITATQFHPEKSQAAGLALLSAFLRS
jgi:glutamine amidotransferase